MQLIDPASPRIAGACTMTGTGRATRGRPVRWLRRLSAVGLVLVGACGSRAVPAAGGQPAAGAAAGGVPRADAHRFVEDLVSTAAMRADEQPMGLAMACAEVSGCAGSCGPGLKAYPNAGPVDRDVAFLRGCAEARRDVMGDPAASRPPGPASADGSGRVVQYLRRRTGAYADRARPSLSADDRAALRRARATLGI